MTPSPAPSDRGVAVIVRVPKPRLAPRSLVRSKLRAAVTDYHGLAGLERKAFTIERSSGDFGGVYLWSSRAAAESWFDDGWFRRVRDERGVEPSVTTVDLERRMDDRRQEEVKACAVLGWQPDIASEDPSIERLWFDLGQDTHGGSVVAGGSGRGEGGRPTLVTMWSIGVREVERHVDRWRRIAPTIDDATVTFFAAAASLTNAPDVGSATT